MLGGTNELVAKYINETKKRLCDPERQRVCDCVHISLVSMSLDKCVVARSESCLTMHKQPCMVYKPCMDCTRILQVAQALAKHGYMSLSAAFNIVSPGIRYSAERARSKLLKLPLVAVRIGNPSDGNAYSVLLEMTQGTDYSKIGMILSEMLVTARIQAQRGAALEKSVVKMLLSIAQSDRERAFI